MPGFDEALGTIDLQPGGQPRQVDPRTGVGGQRGFGVAAVTWQRRRISAVVGKGEQRVLGHGVDGVRRGKPPEGWHLTTGHVFTMNGNYWVCLSPACDMVPSQLSATRKTAFGDRLPFMGVRLQTVGDNTIPKDVQSNRFLFLPLNGEVKAFCFNDPSGENSAPTWHTLYAEKKGELGAGFTFIALSTEMGKRRLITHRYPAVVVSQLRYEYALNLMQRLGSSLTRIGLDFVPAAA